jgi:hypothetical protein
VIAEGIRKGHVHSGQLERWLGREELERTSESMRGWYGPPIAMAGIPGAVYAAGGGDFVGDLRAGYEVSVYDRAWEIAKRIRRGMRRVAAKQGSTMNAGFTSLSDIIAEATAGKARDYTFHKTELSVSGAGTSQSYWRAGTTPPAAANASAAPGGDAPTDATTGAFFMTNPTGGDTQHLVSGFLITSIAGTTLLYDRTFQVNKTMASTATEAVTGVPTRYQSTTPGAQDSAEGNILLVEVGVTSLPATAHNWTVCTYTDQGGSASTLPSLTGNASAVAGSLDHPVLQWFAPLESGDRGIRTLTQMQCSASVATGEINFVIGHPIAIMPAGVTGTVNVFDGIGSAFNLVRIFDDAALSLINITKTISSNNIVSGSFRTVAG